MTEAFLKPPARFSHALLLAMVFSVAGLLSVAIGHLPTLVVGVATLLVFLVAFWVFSLDAWVYTALGSIIVSIGALGVLITPIWALLGAARAPSAGAVLLSVAVSLSLVGGVVAVVLHLVPSRVTDQDGPAFTALLTISGLAIVLVVGIVGVQLGLASLFGASASTVVNTAREVGFQAMSTNPLSQVSSLSLLSGACLWLIVQVVRLPLSKRLARGIWHRWLRMSKKDDLLGPGTESVIDDWSEQEQLGTSAEWPMIDDRWIKVLGKVGNAMFYLGFGGLALSLSPEFQSRADGLAFIQAIGSIFGTGGAVQRTLLDFLVWLIGLLIGLKVAWRGLNADWSAYRRRLGYGSGTVLVVAFAGLQGGAVIEFLRNTPALQLVPVGESGPVIFATESGVQFGDVAGLSLQPRPEVFGSWIDGFVALLGPAVFGIGFLAVVVLLAIVLMVVATMFVAGARLTRPGAGIGLLFVSSAGAAVLGAGEMLAIVGGAVALLAWELYTYGGSLERQLDSAATTITAELVHLAASAALIIGAIVVTLLGVRAIAFVPLPPASWQVLAALLLSLGALLLGLLYLGLRGDHSRKTAVEAD